MKNVRKGRAREGWLVSVLARKAVREEVRERVDARAGTHPRSRRPLSRRRGAGRSRGSDGTSSSACTTERERVSARPPSRMEKGCVRRKEQTHFLFLSLGEIMSLEMTCRWTWL